MIPHTKALMMVFGTGTLLVCFGVFFVVQLNEIRLEARWRIISFFSQRGRQDLDRIEREFAEKFISKTANYKAIEFEDLDLIFLDYLADQYFLTNFSKHLHAELKKRKTNIGVCKKKLKELEGTVQSWISSGLDKRIPEKFFSNEMKSDWRIFILLVTLPRFFEKRAQNLLIELTEAMSSDEPHNTNQFAYA